MPQTTHLALKACLSLEEAAQQMGYTRSQLIWTEQVVFDPRTLIKCQQNTCTHYGQNFMCPPNLPRFEQYLEMNRQFRIALLIQQETTLTAGLSSEEIDQQFKALSTANLKNVVKLEETAFRLGFLFAQSLAGGACKLCSPCKARLGEKNCCQPQNARPSMEAIGIDVTSTCERAGFPADFKPTRLLVTGMIYIV